MAKLKVIVGSVLLLPILVVAIYSACFALNDPSLTRTQIFLQIGWMPYAAMIPTLAGVILISSGLEDNAEDE